MIKYLAIATVVIGNVIALPGMATAMIMFYIVMLTPAITWFN